MPQLADVQVLLVVIGMKLAEIAAIIGDRALLPVALERKNRIIRFIEKGLLAQLE